MLGTKRLFARSRNQRSYTVAETVTDAPFDPETDSKMSRPLIDLARTALTESEIRQFIQWYESIHPNWKVLVDYDRNPFVLTAYRRDLI